MPVAFRGSTEELVDLAGTSNNKYYKYYIPGVGTPFPEVNDLDYSMPGLGFSDLRRRANKLGFYCELLMLSGEHRV